MDQNNGKRNYVSVWICQIFFVFFNKLFLEHEDIRNNRSICLRINLIKKSKDKKKIVLSLKKIILVHVYTKQDEKIIHSLFLITSKVIKVIINCLSIKTIPD